MDNEISVRHAPTPAASSAATALAGLRRAFHLQGLSPFRRNLGLTVAGQLGILGIGTLTGLLSARLLGPQGRGQLAALTLWPSTLIFLTHPGTDAALVFHAGKRRFDFSEVWTAGTALGLLQTLLVIPIGLLVLPRALRAYPPQVERLAVVFLCFSPAIIFAGQPYALLQGKLHLGAYNLVRSVAPLTYALGLLTLFFLHWPDLRGVVACQIAGPLLAICLSYYLLFRKERFWFRWNREASKSLLSFGWKTQLSNVASFANLRLDQLLLSLFVPPRQLGLYVVAVTVSLALSFFPQAAGIVTYATGSNLSAREAGSIIARSLRACLVGLGLGCTGLFLIAPWLIPFAFGRDFAGSVSACRILLPGAVALGLTQVLYDGARALNQPALPSHAEGCSLVVTLGCLYLLVPRFGFMGAAVTSTVAYSSSLVVALALFGMRLGLGWRELLGVSHPRAEQPS